MLREDNEQCGDLEGPIHQEKTGMSGLAYIGPSVCGELQEWASKTKSREQGFGCLLTDGKIAKGGPGSGGAHL